MYEDENLCEESMFDTPGLPKPLSWWVFNVFLHFVFYIFLKICLVHFVIRKNLRWFWIWYYFIWFLSYLMSFVHLLFSYFSIFICSIFAFFCHADKSFRGGCISCLLYQFINLHALLGGTGENREEPGRTRDIAKKTYTSGKSTSCFCHVFHLWMP